MSFTGGVIKALIPRRSYSRRKRTTPAWWLIINCGFWPFAARLPVRKEQAESDRRWWTAVLLMLASNQLDLLPDSQRVLYDYQKPLGLDPSEI